MLVASLTILGLAAASYASADVSGNGSVQDCRTSLLAAAGHAKHDPARDFYPSTQALRQLNRRAGMSSQPDGKPLLLVVSASGFAGLEPASVSFRVIAAPPELVRGWQFHCRAVAEARAPSTVS